MQNKPLAVADRFYIGMTGIYHLKRIWSKLLMDKVNEWNDEVDLDYAIINVLGIGLLPLFQFVYAAEDTKFRAIGHKYQPQQQAIILSGIINCRTTAALTMRISQGWFNI